MREGVASETARRTALQRAAHQLFDEPVVFPDNLAVPILGPGAEATLRSAEAEYRSDFGYGFRSVLVARSRYCQDCMIAAMDRGLRQVVILGAGLDTTAYRGVLPADAKVYEVDYPATQAWKKEMLRAAGIAIPPSVGFITIDFDRMTLSEGLRAGSVDLTRPIFFSWLGVTFYLEADSVAATLADVGSLAPGGEIVFDYLEPGQNYPAVERPGFDSIRELAANVGEPWKSFFEPPGMAAMLRAGRLTALEDLGCKVLAARYFAGRSDDLMPKGPMHYVHARTGA